MIEWQGYVFILRDKEPHVASDLISIDIETWDTLDRLRFWDTINKRCDVFLCRYNETWFEEKRVADVRVTTQDFLRRVVPSSVPPVPAKVVVFLERVAQFSREAEERNVPLIFSL